VLSIGSGWGATEAWLAQRGLKVTAVPLDPIISSCTGTEGVETVPGDFEDVQKQLAGRTFDCLLLMNVLHLVEDPVALLASFEKLLTKQAVVISLVPNMARAAKPWSKAKRRGIVVVDYEVSGAHFVSQRVIRQWFQQAGLRVKKTIQIMTPRAQMFSDLVFGLADSTLSSEFLTIAEFRG
jgi:2-polyprenyl-3-methyl-5-hydroxy-6-metoxy-1,4-benzoquinol methylase